jgi:hypothetical protein
MFIVVTLVADRSKPRNEIGGGDDAHARIPRRLYGRLRAEVRGDFRAERDFFEVGTLPVVLLFVHV